MFRIDIRNPRHGWIDVDFVLGDRRFELTASHVLNDPVTELAELALFVARSDPGQADVTFWLEPAGYGLRASRGPDLKLAVLYAEYAGRRLWDPSVVSEHPVGVSSTASEIVRCLRAAQPAFEAACAADSYA